MVEEILQPLVAFLCPTSDAASACNDFINSHSSVLPPIGPLFYFLLFPIVFTILFIYILSSTILHGGNLTKGMKLLIGISVFIFIIISGWYPVMLILSEFWFIFIIVILGMWYFIGKHRGGGGSPGGGGPKGAMEAVRSEAAGLGGELVKRGLVEVTGQKKRLEKKVDLAIKEMQKLSERMKRDPSAWRAYASRIEACWALIGEYKELISVGHIPVGGGLKDKVGKLEDILDNLEDTEAKIEKHYKRGKPYQ